MARNRWARSYRLWRTRGESKARSISCSTTGCGPILGRHPHFHTLCQLAERGLQRISNLPKAAHRRVDDPSLHAAEVRTIKAALAAEALLRMARLFPEFAHH